MSNEHMMTHDIDWFCVVDHRYPLHLASNGSLIPPFAADRELLASIQQYVFGLPDIPNNVLQPNDNHLKELEKLDGFNKNRYLFSFRFFARKGFYSFDFEWSNDSEGKYKLLIAPQHPISHDELRNIPQISTGDLDDRSKEMFLNIVQQIRNLE